MHKNQEEYQYSFQIKQLYKKFKILDQPSIRLIFQFCQFDIIKATKVLTMTNDLKSPMAVVKKLYDHPQQGQDFVHDLCYRYDKKYGFGTLQNQFEKYQEKKENIQIQKKFQIQNLGWSFFKDVPQDVIISIMNFLDPYSFINLAMTSNLMYKLSKSEALFDYYKRLCMVLFQSYQPRLPEPSRFLGVRQYVLQRPNQFTPNTRNFVTNQLSYFVWKTSPESFKLDKNYYLSFGSYRSIFEKCPRINFNGYYVCRQRYIKIGQKSLYHAFAPIIIIYYYRYLRFLSDNSVLYYVSAKKLKNQKVEQVLSIKNLNGQVQNNNGDGQTFIGQFMQFKQKVYIKVVKNNSIFGFNLQIRSTQNKISNELNVKQYSLQLIDEAQIIQKLFEWRQNKQEMYFEYVMNENIRQQNDMKIRGISL